MTGNIVADGCSLCDRRKMPGSEFCSLHNTALLSVEGAYSSWNKAYGGKLSKEEYFTRLSSLNQTGRAVKEVIEHLRAKGASKQL